VLLVNFNLKHGIGEGLNHFALNFDLILFWHSFLSLSAYVALSRLRTYKNALGAAAVTRFCKTGSHVYMIDDCWSVMISSHRGDGLC
jgi:hypothetical protein